MPISPFWVSDGSPIPDPLGHGERAVKFLKNLRHPKSSAPGRAFRLDPWVERIVRRIYGPCHSDGTRIVRTVFAMIPRGNRKTSLGAALMLLHLIGPERVPGGQIVAAAADQKQASIAFEEATSILRDDRRLLPLVRISDHVKKIVHVGNSAKLEAISADGPTQHGRTPNLVLMDELHAWRGRGLWEALRTGLIKTPGSLNVIITTAGRGQENVGWEQYSYARKVQLGEIDDPATLPVIYEATADDDWRDERVWHAVNPGLAYGYPDLPSLRQYARECENRPAERESFRQLNLNVWLDGSADPFVDMATYDLGAAPIDIEALAGRTAWIAVDASATTDLTAVVAVFRDGDTYTALPQFFLPGDQLRARGDRDGVPYQRWAEEGLLTATPGSVIDYAAVAEHIRQLCRTYRVAEIAFDPAYSRQISIPLMEEGLPVIEFRQNWSTMGPAIAELERAIVGGNFRHGGNPLLRWNFANIALRKDSNGNPLFHKAKSTGRIDGAVASAMAVARAAAGDSGISIYEDTEARPEGILFI